MACVSLKDELLVSLYLRHFVNDALVFFLVRPHRARDDDDGWTLTRFLRPDIDRQEGEGEVDAASERAKERGNDRQGSDDSVSFGD